MKLTRLVPALVLALVATAPAAAAAPAGPEPWQPYPSKPFVLPAGVYCPFQVNVGIVADEGEIRVDARYPDGKVRVNEYRGKLVVDFVGNGKSAVRDLSGIGWMELYPDGVSSKSFTAIGPFGARFQARDKFPQGYYRFDGFTVITFDPDGTRHVPVPGPHENICQTLS
jgi:hypothetical protein